VNDECVRRCFCEALEGILPAEEEVRAVREAFERSLRELEELEGKILLSEREILAVYLMGFRGAKKHLQTLIDALKETEGKLPEAKAKLERIKVEICPR